MNPDVRNELMRLRPETVGELHMENFPLNFSKIRASH